MRNKIWGRYALMLLMMLAVGCTRTQKSGLFGNDRVRLAQADDFSWLLLRAGVEPEVWPSTQEITVQQAQDLRAWIEFALLDGHMASYGPRRTVEFLMDEIIAGGKPVARSTVSQQLSRFQGRFLLRPDAYVVEALGGKPLHSVGSPRVVKGVVMAANLRLGTFYRFEGASLREDAMLVIRPPPPTGDKVSSAQK